MRTDRTTLSPELPDAGRILVRNTRALKGYPAGLRRLYKYGHPTEGADMAAIQHEFYRSFRGPGPADEDWWSLVFDPETRRLLVRHEWEASGHGGFDDWDVTEFLQQTGSAQTALIDSLFRVPVDA